jgi:hypothetical protein
LPALRLVLRILGWLLTPLVALAASFVGATFGTIISEWVDSPTVGLVVTVLLGAIAGFTALIFWFRFLRHSPKVTHALHLEETIESPIVALVAAEPGTDPVEEVPEAPAPEEGPK